MAHHTKHVPVVSSMLQTFSKSFSKIEDMAPKVKKTSLGTQAKTQGTTHDMDAINTLLQKVKENLIKAQQLAYQQYVQNRKLWQNNKQERRRLINVDWVSFYTNYRNQGRQEAYCGDLRMSAARQDRKSAQNRYEGKENEYLQDFLQARCDGSRLTFQANLATKNNEEEALIRVTRYLEKIQPKWKNKHNSIQNAYAPYKWKLEKKPTYITVKNTYSTTDHHSAEDVSCRTSFRTVFKKIRILTAKDGNRPFIDPNDLTHSVNLHIGTKQKIKDINCQLFPSGVAVGRAHSCSSKKYSTAKIDLRGTPYKFGRDAKAMFKVVGRLSYGHSGSLGGAKFSYNDQVVELKARGHCGDIYTDDGANDYRSDPIPLTRQLVTG
jgi:hypothetical protein